jgi:hypothetical protein
MADRRDGWGDYSAAAKRRGRGRRRQIRQAELCSGTAASNNDASRSYIVQDEESNDHIATTALLSFNPNAAGLQDATVHISLDTTDDLEDTIDDSTMLSV